jgi:hypothetical protein
MENNLELTLIVNEELADLKNVANILSLNINRTLRLLKESVKLGDHTDDNEKFTKYMFDIIRASVVFLHSTLETTLREVVRLKLKYDGDISGVPLAEPSGYRKEKFSLDDLVKYRGYTVDKVIEMSIDRYLSNLSFNNTDDIANILSKMKFSQSKLTPFYAELNQMMTRRHQIVHEGDLKRGSRTVELEVISPNQIKAWIECTANFSAEVLRLAVENLCLDRIAKRLDGKGISFDKNAILLLIKVEVSDTYN